MKIYIYYSKYDPAEEPHGKVKAKNLAEAIDNAALIKNMDNSEFLSLFNVKLYERKKD